MVYLDSDVVIHLICAYCKYLVPSSGLLLFVAYYRYLIYELEDFQANSTTNLEMVYP